MILSGLLVVLGGLVLGLALVRLMAESFAFRLAFLFDRPTAIVLAALMAFFMWSNWRQFGRRFAGRADRSPADILVFDALAHLSLLLPALYLLSPGVDMPRGWALVGGALALFIAWRVRHLVALGLIPQSWLDRMLYATLFGLPLIVYLYTLTPGVGTKDGFELQVVSATLGIAHPTGYPLFTLLGRLFVALLPVGSPAYRINLMCALFAALCVPFVYATAQRLLARRAPAVLAALVFASSPTFWRQASIPEKYTLNVLFVTLVLYLAVRWRQEEGAVRVRCFNALALVYGLSLTHHRTMLLLGPGLALYVLLSEPGLLRQPKRLLVALVWGMAPLLLYLYIPWRAYAQGWQMTWAEFLAHVSGSEYAPALRLDEWLTSAERRATFLRFLQQQFGYPGIGLGVVGWVYLAWRRRRFALSALLAWVVYVIFSIGYHAYYNDVNYFLPSHLIFALWIGAGLAALAGALAALRRRWRGRPRLASLATVGYWTLAVLLPLQMIGAHWLQVDASGAQNDLPWARYTLNLDLPYGATILADSVKVAPLHYLTAVEKVRSDVQVVVLPDETAYLKSLEAHLAQGLPVYLARYLPNLGGAYYLRSLGSLVEVSLTPLAEPPAIAHPLEAVWEGGIRLLGYDAPRLVGPRQGRLHVTLYWQPTTSVAQSYQPRLRLSDAEGQVWWEEKGQLPVSDEYPTNAWRAGEVIPDYHQLPIEATLQPGDYTLEVGLYPPFAQTGLPLANAATDRVALGQVIVTPGWEGEPPPPTLPLRQPLTPDLMLVGLDAPGQVRPGSQVRLRLHWLVLWPPSDYALSVVRWADGEGQPAPSEASPPFGATDYATADWLVGDVVITQHSIVWPSEAGEGSGRVQVRLQHGGRSWQSGPLAAFEVRGAPVAGRSVDVNFGDQMRLLTCDVGPSSLRPGDVVSVEAEWQALAEMAEDYTIFVHLLGPDGLSHGQVDVWPQDGTYPTSAWPVGEVVADSYRVPLEADAPPGAYRVEVGVYLLRTMARLPVLDDAGRAIDDRLLIEGLVVGE